MAKGLTCPSCNATKTHVDDTRKVDGGIERRRVCSLCQHQFVTYEGLRSEWSRQRLTVWKRGGHRVYWNTETLLRDLEPAFKKNEFVSRHELEEMVERVRVKAHQRERGSITTAEIEDIVLAELKSDERYAGAWLWYFAPIAAKTAPDVITAILDSLPVFDN